MSLAEAAAGASPGAMTLAVLPVDDRPAGARPPSGLPLREAAAWYEAVSHGRFVPSFVMLAPVTLPRPLGYYAPRGGMGPAPHNSQNLAADAVERVGAADRARLAECGQRLLLVAPHGFHPHTWRFRGGGHHLGDGRWCRHYTLLPAAAPLGSLLHEIGHLALGWPDLGPASNLGERCLMAAGCSRAGGADPAAPCAPLMVRAGWRRALAVDRGTPVAALDPDVGTFNYAGGDILVQRHRAAPTAARAPGELLVFGDRGGSPLLAAALPLSAADLSRPVLALLASTLRRLPRA